MYSVRLSLFLFLLVGHLALMVDAGLAGLAVYGVCQTGCNAAWVACVAAAGGTAGVSTGRIWHVTYYLEKFLFLYIDFPFHQGVDPFHFFLKEIIELLLKNF